MWVAETETWFLTPISFNLCSLICLEWQEKGKLSGGIWLILLVCVEVKCCNLKEHNIRCHCECKMFVANDKSLEIFTLMNWKQWKAPRYHNNSNIPGVSNDLKKRMYTNAARRWRKYGYWRGSSVEAVEMCDSRCWQEHKWYRDCSSSVMCAGEWKCGLHEDDGFAFCYYSALILRKVLEFVMCYVPTSFFGTTFTSFNDHLRDGRVQFLHLFIYTSDIANYVTCLQH